MGKQVVLHAGRLGALLRRRGRGFEWTVGAGCACGWTAAPVVISATTNKLPLRAAQPAWDAMRAHVREATQ